MNAKFLILFSLLALPLQAYQGRQTAPPSGQLQRFVADLRHELNNQETEIRIFENRLQNQEAAFDQMRQQLSEEMDGQREAARNTAYQLEDKVQALDQTVQMLIGDLRLLKNQANESASLIEQYKKKLQELDSLLQAQNKHMASLETALQSIVDVWQAKEVAAEQMTAKLSSKTYKVQSGDSLGKIAATYKISTQSLKERNQLTSDRIHAGQILIIP
ncbi:MAG: LysM peptidoglycan-binding domain-containing protein [Parachlamydia sp.]|jgi:chromosome segregation ATPase|nr:LysM peptidoglycan-binding domain-containing protein [Parachlamydia sp.]